MEAVFILILTIAKYDTGVAVQKIEFNSLKECKATGYLWEKKVDDLDYMNKGNIMSICVKKIIKG